MKWLKKFESADDDSRLKFTHIVEILDDLADDPSFDVHIISGTGIPLHLSSYDSIGGINFNDVFKLKRWEGARDSFSIRVNFRDNLNYAQTIDILERFRSFVGRFDDLGFYLYRFWLNSDSDSDQYRLQSIEYKFESYEK